MNNTITNVGYVGQNQHVISFGDTGNKVVKFSAAVKEFSANANENKTLWLPAARALKVQQFADFFLNARNLRIDVIDVF